MDQKTNLLKNTLIIAVGKLSTQFLTFLLLPLYTAYLQTNEFGTVDLLLTYASLLAPIVTLQLEMGMFRLLIDARGNRAESAQIITSALRIVGIVVAVFVVGLIVVHHFININYVLYLAGIIFSTILINMLLQIARGFGDNVKYSIASMVAGVVAIALNIILIVEFGMGARGMMIAMIGGNVASALYLVVALRMYRYINLTLRNKSMELTMIKYSVPLVPNGVSWWLINAADRTIISIMLGVASNGVYAVAYKFPLIFTGLFSFFNMSWTEAASINVNSRERNKFFSESMDMGLRLFGSLALCVVAGVSVFFNLLVNHAYSEAYLYIPILMLGSFFGSLVSMYGAIYIAKKMTRQVMYSSIVSAIITLILTIVLMPALRLYAPAIGMVVGYGSMVIYRHYDVKKYVSVRYSVKTLGVLSGTAAVVALLYYINNSWLNIMNLVLACGVSLMLNRNIVQAMHRKIFARLRPLSSSQLVEEELEERKGL